MTETNPITCNFSYFPDYLQGLLQNEKYKNNQNIFSKNLKLLGNASDWKQFEFDYLSKEYTVFYLKSSFGFIFNKTTKNYLDFSFSSNSIDLDLYGDKQWIDGLEQKIRSKFTVVDTSIRWYYDEKGNHTSLPIRNDNLPITEMYPFLSGEKLEEYYQRYLDSSSSILLLIGEPGTGKTSFIKGLLSYAKQSAFVSYNFNLLQDDGIFVDFINSDSKFMIIEDCDSLLRPRTDGNTVIHKFLNISDGLIQTNNKKFIFSTNLPSTRDIDPALVRPGRCFDILEFSLLDRQQAENLANSLGRDFKQLNDLQKYSIADVFSEYPKTPTNSVNNKMGFI